MEADRREAWLEEVMEKWAAGILRTCYAYLGDRALAEDALQETFLKAWKGYDCFRGEAQEKTWLMRIAINTCKDVRRSAYFRHVDRSVPIDELPEGSVPFTMEDDTVTRAVMRLKNPIKEAVLLCWYWQCSAGEAAQVLGISRTMVYKRLERARRILREELGAWYDEEE